MKINQTPYIWNGPVQRINVEESTRHKWVNSVLLMYKLEAVVDVANFITAYEESQ